MAENDQENPETVSETVQEGAAKTEKRRRNNVTRSKKNTESTDEAPQAGEERQEQKPKRRRQPRRSSLLDAGEEQAPAQLGAAQKARKPAGRKNTSRTKGTAAQGKSLVKPRRTSRPSPAVSAAVKAAEAHSQETPQGEEEAQAPVLSAVTAETAAAYLSEPAAVTAQEAPSPLEDAGRAETGPAGGMEADAHTAPDAPAFPGTDEEPRDVPDWDSGWTDSETVSGQDAGSSAGGEDFSAEEDASGSAASDGESADWREWSGWNDDDERYDADSLDADTSLQGNDGAPAQENQEEDENAASAGTASSDDETESEQDGGDRKKRRRGRRGGRGHGRKSSEGRAAQENAENQTPEHVRTEPVSQTAPQQQRRPAGRRCMYISILPGEQVEVALTNNGVLEEHYLDMLHQKKIKGNIYRGVIHNIDTNLQAAFIDFGEEKNGFLQIDEIHPEYYSGHFEPARGKKFPPIQKVLHIGQEVLVQVVKEPNGSKGAFLTTWISLAGRFLVLTPGQEQIGISRKVSDEEERSRLRELMHGIDPGDDLGVIVRTVSAGVTQATLKNDLVYLKRTWAEVRKKATEVKAPACVYREPGLPERAIRDYLTDDVTEVWVDDADMAERIRNTVALLFPNKKELVRLHNDTRRSMWERFNLRRQLDQIYSREVLMPSGGRLCFDQTEALMAIDINSGKISGKGNFEAMAFKTNMEAAETIARQLKLRDIGGQVVIDFIEMKEHKHVAEVERTLRNAMKYDRARHDIAHMSSFGLLELVRQRTGNSAISISMEPCPACGGTGLRRNLEWQSLQALRDIARALRSRSSSPCQYELPQELGLYLLNHKRDALKELEQRFNKNIEITIKP